MPRAGHQKEPSLFPPEPCVPLVLLLLLQEGQLGCRPTRAADGCKGCKVGDGCKQMGVISSSLIDEEMEKVESAQLEPLAGSTWRQQHNPLELFCHANPWKIAADVALVPAVASLSAAQQKAASNSAPRGRSFCKALAVLQVLGAWRLSFSHH